MAKTMIHPVYVKKNAVNTRNARNVLTHTDKMRFYGIQAQRAGRSVVDIKNDILRWKQYLQLFGK